MSPHPHFCLKYPWYINVLKNHLFFKKGGEHKIHFSKIPNSLFYVGEGDSIYSQINDEKIILILDYLYYRTDRRGISFFAIEDIVLKSRFMPKSGRGNIDDKFKKVIYKMIDIELLSFMSPIQNLKSKQFYECTLNIDYNNNFFQLFDNEKDKIINIQNGKCYDLKILLYYCYLKSRMFNSGSTLPTNALGGKASVCYPSYELINKDINLASDTVNKYNTILSKLNLIRYANAGNYIDKVTGENKTSTNTYAIFKPDGSHEYEIKEAIKAYKLDPNKKFIKKKITKRTRSDTGFIVQMNIKIKKGVKLTSKQQKRYDDIIRRTGDYI